MKSFGGGLLLLPGWCSLQMPHALDGFAAHSRCKMLQLCPVLEHRRKGPFGLCYLWQEVWKIVCYSKYQVPWRLQGHVNCRKLEVLQEHSNSALCGFHDVTWIRSVVKLEGCKLTAQMHAVLKELTVQFITLNSAACANRLHDIIVIQMKGAITTNKSYDFLIPVKHFNFGTKLCTTTADTGTRDLCHYVYDCWTLALEVSHYAIRPSMGYYCVSDEFRVMILC